MNKKERESLDLRQLLAEELKASPKKLKKLDEKLKQAKTLNTINKKSE